MRAFQAVVLALWMLGCSAQVEPIDSNGSALIAANKLATNKLAVNRITLNKIATNKLATNKLATNKLATNKLATNRVELDADAAADLLASEEGRELLSYTIRCALRSDAVVTAVHGGNQYEFHGELGLAPKWLTRPLSRKDQRWVSACLLARTNAYGISVQISLRGHKRALAAGADEMAGYSLEEGAFWGNVFGDELDWNACRGIDQAASETGDLDKRDCTEPDPQNPGYTLCGFKDAGVCGDFSGQEPACRSFDAEGMYYGGCSGTGRKHDRYREVITVFVQP